MRKGYWEREKVIEKISYFRTRFQHHIHIDNQDWLVMEGSVGVILHSISIYFKQMSAPCSKPLQHKSSPEEYQNFAEGWTASSFSFPCCLTSLYESQLQFNYNLYSRLRQSFTNTRRNLAHFEVPSHLLSTIRYCNKADTCPSREPENLQLVSSLPYNGLTGQSRPVGELGRHLSPVDRKR